uniref:Expressed protein n=1 Tax=Oryza sativa subsp. japonica TaxID=39947 RepID=Q84MF4_ORYSJ|nr:expressed protein [Oryza sativa Japonica Group]
MPYPLLSPYPLPLLHSAQSTGGEQWKPLSSFLLLPSPPEAASASPSPSPSLDSLPPPPPQLRGSSRSSLPTHAAAAPRRNGSSISSARKRTRRQTVGVQTARLRTARAASALPARLERAGCARVRTPAFARRLAGGSRKCVCGVYACKIMCNHSRMGFNSYEKLLP